MFSSLNTKFSSGRLIIAIIVIAAIFSVFAGSARAEPATVYPQSPCVATYINGSYAGDVNVVFQGSNLVLTGCIGSGTPLAATVQFSSGNCHQTVTRSGRYVLICTRQ